MGRDTLTPDEKFIKEIEDTPEYKRRKKEWPGAWDYTEWDELLDELKK